MTCGSCEAAMSDEARRSSARLMTVQALGESRIASLKELFGGTVPAGLCGVCFLAILSVLNSGGATHRQAA